MLYKLILLGNKGTGKTAAVTRFVDGKFPSSPKSTINADYLFKKIKTGSSEVDLSCWDTAGDERFSALSSRFYEKTDAFLLFYDLTNQETLANIRHWLEKIKASKFDVKNCVFVLVGNKKDLHDQRVISELDVRQMLDCIKEECQLDELPQHHEISAKQGDGIEKLFQQLAQQLLKKQPPENSDGVVKALSSNVKATSNNDQTVNADYSKKSRNIGIGVAALVAVAIIVLSIVFWPSILALSAIDLVFLPIFAAITTALFGLSASIIADTCAPVPAKSGINPMHRAYAELGIEEIRPSYLDQDMPLDDEISVSQLRSRKPTSAPQSEPSTNDDSERKEQKTMGFCAMQ